MAKNKHKDRNDFEEGDIVVLKSSTDCLMTIETVYEDVVDVRYFGFNNELQSATVKLSCIERFKG